VVVGVAFAPHAANTITSTPITAARGSTNFLVLIGFSFLDVLSQFDKKREVDVSPAFPVSLG
jgi:hypothetical protein